MSGYQPGRCNIGGRQRRKRALVAAVSFVAAAAIVAAYLVGRIPEELLVAVFVPLSVGFEWAFQAYEAFCVRLALLGRYNFCSDDGDEAERGDVTDPSHQQADRMFAAKITVVSVALAAAVTVLLVALL
ncbi:hypothetical protein [Halobaculum sp. D14]|uniref:hypothetical protein n=1 Tax=unclassified Halobaculum TaxID=2640896 RepID=UPI003EBE04E4